MDNDIPVEEIINNGRTPVVMSIKLIMHRQARDLLRKKSQILKKVIPVRVIKWDKFPSHRRHI